MCGFIGIFSKPQIDRELLNSANECIVCRGPDKSLEYYEELSANVNFASIFNRLSIIDLDDSAMQPMHSKVFNSLILFNGEIFNHRELRKNLQKEGVSFKTSHSDTEVLLNGFSKHGEGYLSNLIGQFTFCLFDKKNNEIYLARDRLGQKPLFYRNLNNQFSFSSNLEGLITYHQDKDISAEGLIEYLNFGVVKSPNTLYQNYFKLEPGTIMKVNLESFKTSKKKYWNIESYVGNEKFNEDEFFNLLNSAVSLRMESDVPVANFLSGGIDSTTIIKELSDGRFSKINSFSVKHEDSKYDESQYIDQVVKKYNTNHTYKIFDSEIKTNDIIDSINAFDEPYADPSTVPSFLLSKIISEDYKVAISGDGGDELLGGYDRFNQAFENRNYFDGLISNFFQIYPASFGTGTYFKSKSSDYSVAYSSYFEDIKLLRLFGLNFDNNKTNKIYTKDFDKYKSLMLTEYKLYLSEMMMLKVDRTSMANSLEVRSPFVDHRLIEYILKSDYKYFDKDYSKKLLKNKLKIDFDNKFLNRPKQGFVFNIEEWVFKNNNLIEERIEGGIVSEILDKNIIKKLTRVKSRMNANRIWKIFFLETYWSRINSK